MVRKMVKKAAFFIISLKILCFVKKSRGNRP
jgi:hypothetical protein